MVGEWVQLTRWPTSGHRTSVREHHTTHTVLHMYGNYKFLCTCMYVCVGGESAVKLLTKFGLLETAVDYATDHL